MLQGVVFDMNGVIIDDERIHQQSWRYFCRKYGFKLTEDEFKNKVFGRTEADTLAYLFKSKLSDNQVSQYSNERISTIIQVVKDTVKIATGLKQFLQELHDQSIPLAIATSSRKPYTDFIIDFLEIRPFFKSIITAEDIKKGKPDPEIYLLAAHRLSVSPKNCLAFEDSLSGIKSAKRAGMKVIGIATTHRPEELTSANMVINSFQEVTVSGLKKL